MIVWGENKPLADLQIRLDADRIEQPETLHEPDVDTFRMSGMFELIPENDRAPLQLPGDRR